MRKLLFYIQFFLGIKRIVPKGARTFSSDCIYVWDFNVWYFTEFMQKFGVFEYVAKLDGNFTEVSRPALWLVNSNKYYSEIDIELMLGNDLVLTTWWNENGNTSEGTEVWRAKFRNKRFINSLKTSFHTYTIKWDEKRVRYYLDGILMASTRNAPKEPMCVVVGEVTIKNVSVYK